MAARKNMKGEAPSSKPVPAKDMDESEVTNEEKEMSLEDKLDYIDQEIRKLHVFCINSGYSTAQVEKFADPFFSSVKSAKRERWLKRAVKFAFVVAIAAAVIQIDPAYRLVCAVCKKGAISVLPIWDWTKLYDNECLINNPNYVGSELKPEDCEMCEGITEVDLLSNVTAEEFVTYVKRTSPVVIDDAIQDWPSLESFSITKLAKIYKKTVGLNDRSSCMYSSNLRGEHKDPRSLLADVRKKGTTHFYAHWENCFSEGAKAFRHHYKRPYFFPSIVEMGINNWVFIASQYHGTKPKSIEMGTSLQVLAVVKGNMQVIMKPKEPCDKICLKLNFLLTEGQLLVMNDMLWSLSYIPRADDESIAIGFGGSVF